ncbi:MAG: oligopeptide/dipeptide ABC transporter ATP-binding protein, partial [Anaerolineae bacterium]
MKDRKDLPVLRVENLSVSYATRKGEVPAVRDVSFAVHRGETFGMVGESGCGKSTVAFSIVNFLGPNGRIKAGRIFFQGQDLVGRSQRELQHLRGNRIAMVYQDPMQALNPSLRIGEQMAEVLIVHQGLKKAEAEERCIQMLERVYMPDPANVMRRYPHQLSGGQQQRVVIAMALLNDPALLIMDEPTTALDVTVEAAVLDLIAGLQEDFDTAILYISHNLGVIARVSDQVGVMYAGQLVERAPVGDLFLRPFHPYTQGLLRCVPRLGQDKLSSYPHPIRGQVPSPADLPPGCIFEPRCEFARPECRRAMPEFRELPAGHWVRCLFAEEIASAGVQPPKELVAEMLAPARKEREPVLEVKGLKTYYEVPSPKLFDRRKRYVRAVDDVSLQAYKGLTLGIVGESGCGKSTLARTIIGLERATDGKMEFMGFDIRKPVSKRDIELIKNMQMVFQN